MFTENDYMMGFINKRRRQSNVEMQYESMSNLAKDVHDARKEGLTYGHYMAKKNAQPMKKVVERRQADGSIKIY